MIVNMSEKATEQEINHVIERIREADTSLMSRAAPSAPSSPRWAADAATRSKRSRSLPEWTTSSPSPNPSSWSAAR